MDLISEIKKLSNEWQTIFNNHIPLILDLQHNLNKDKEHFNDKLVFPNKEKIFNTFNYINPDEIKIIIIGQDCYHQKNQATGLAFAIDDSIKIPPSLKNIEKELYNDLQKKLKSYNLNYWNSQGVLLLNTSLTVRESSPGSHIKYWMPLIRNIIKDLLNRNPEIIVFLWGKFSQKLFHSLDINYRKEFIFKANHPSPLSANRGGWFHSKHFSNSNNLLVKIGKLPINW